MILVGVRDDECVKFAYADVVQKRNDNVFAGILAAVVACIDEKMSARWRFDEVAIALLDINGRERPRRVHYLAVAFKCK